MKAERLVIAMIQQDNRVERRQEMVELQKYTEGRVTRFTVGLDVAWDSKRGINDS